MVIEEFCAVVLGVFKVYLPDETTTQPNPTQTNPNQPRQTNQRPNSAAMSVEMSLATASSLAPAASRCEQ